MGRMAMPGSPLPEGFVLGAMSHADRIGLVYDAVSPDGGPAVSAQVLHPLHVDELREWFEANALMGLGLRHPNLVRVFAVGETHNGLPVMITERIEGRTLRARIAAGDLLAGHDLGRVVRSVADALDFLHAQRVPVLHRALSPENVICTLDGAVKLLAVGQADCPRYAPTKPSYLSPEELCGAIPSPASDVFSLASLTFELLTGRPAFAGSADGIVRSVQRGALPFVGVVHSDALSPINRALHRAWVASPRDRTPRAGVFASELEDALRVVPASLLSLRRGYREGPPRSSVPAPRTLRASQPPGPPRQPSLPAPPRSAGRPMALAARSATPFPAALPMHRSTSAVYALPAPPKLPTALEAPTERAEGVFELVPRSLTPTPRELPVVVVPTEVPAPAAEPREAPRTRVDTDDAVLILEPSLVDAADLPPPDDALPPLESVVPWEDDAPEVSLFDEPDARVQRTNVIDAGPPPRASSESPPTAVATPPPAAMTATAPRPSLALAEEFSPLRDSRPGWQRWRPTVPSRPSNRPWHAREMRFTPRIVALIIASNLVLTALLVWALVMLTRR